MKGGNLFVDGSPWENVDEKDVVADDETKLYLLNHPFGDEIVIMADKLKVT